MKAYSYFAAATVAASILVGGVNTARGELVFEDDLNNNNTNTNQEQHKDISKSEALRRQRMREELKNEDLLSQKLEELRLKDEMKRTDQLVGSGVNKDVSSSQALPEQKVGVASAANPNLYNTNVNVNGAPIASASTAVVSTEGKEKSEENNGRVSINPRGGISGIANSIYNIQSKYSLGVGLSVDVSDYIAVVGGYTYSSYGLNAGSSVITPYGFATMPMQQLQLNDNVFDIGARGFLMDQHSKVRPFVGAGLGYRRGYVNYDDRTLSFLRQINRYAAQDVQISGFTGYVETGLELRLSKSISLNASFRYYNLLSSYQSAPLNEYAFLNPNGYYNGMGGYGYSNDARSQASNALARNNFYQIMAGLSIGF